MLRLMQRGWLVLLALLSLVWLSTQVKRGAAQDEFKVYLPVAARQATAVWLGEYFNNPVLSGNPALVRADADVDFAWGTAPPAAGIASDNFSVRWTRSLDLPAGYYRFSALADDGVRLWLDGSLILDQWREQSSTEYSAYLTLTVPSAPHRLRLEYYDALGEARARLWWQNLTEYPERWRGEYFANPTLSGEPAVISYESDVDFDWGLRSPFPERIPADGFSARWTRTLALPGGQYRACTYTDDGVRLWVDSQLVVDLWHDTSAVQRCADVSLSPGYHTLKMEYYDAARGAVAKLWWFRSTSDYPFWRGEYFNKREPATSDRPVFVRADPELNFDWGQGSPGPGLSPDNFFVRWTGLFYLPGGSYRFTASTDDGVRLWIDDVLAIDNWQVQARQSRSVDVDLASAYHRLKVEYFDATLEAVAQLKWESLGQPGVTSAAPPDGRLVRIRR